MKNDKYLENILNRIGKSVFVKYYYDFKNGDNQVVISKMANEPFTEKSKSSRASKGIRLFREGLHIEALEMIINSNRLDDEIINRAKEIYKKER